LRKSPSFAKGSPIFWRNASELGHPIRIGSQSARSSGCRHPLPNSRRHSRWASIIMLQLLTAGASRQVRKTYRPWKKTSFPGVRQPVRARSTSRSSGRWFVLTADAVRQKSLLEPRGQLLANRSVAIYNRLQPSARPQANHGTNQLPAFRLYAVTLPTCRSHEPQGELI
jgi:hypothetical protein